MTLKELHERVGWQLEGRLQYLTFEGNWVDVSENYTLKRDGYASHFRRRPDAPDVDMPDEVWLPRLDSTRFHRDAYDVKAACEANHFEPPVRYVRADGVFSGERLQTRIKHDGHNLGNWQTCVANQEFRFTP